MLNLRGVGRHGFACGLIRVRSQSHINRLNLPGPMGRLPAETEPQDSVKTSAFSESERAIPSGVTRVGVGVVTLITLLVIFHSD
jgi:hypothetical protein